MYRGHTIAQYKNMFDIADIYGDRRGIRTCWTLYNLRTSVSNFDIEFTSSKGKQNGMIQNH
jgi:hypothetical protein